MTLDPVVVIIALLLWLMLIIVSVILEESYTKRIPAHKLRFPRYLGAVGIGFPFACGWMICEMLQAEDWEEAQLIYLICISFFFLFGIGGTWLFLHVLNWGIDIKEDRIVYRTAFRRTRTILFTEITKIEHRNPRFGHKKRRHSTRLFDLEEWIMELIGLIGPKKISSYRIYIGKRSIQVDSIVCNYDSSAARILKAMKKQGITCPVTTKKTRFS